MKKLIFVFLMFASACTPAQRGLKVQVGDCLSLEGTAFKVIQDGKYSYLLMDQFGYTRTRLHSQSMYEREVDCFDWFDGVKAK